MLPQRDQFLLEKKLLNGNIKKRSPSVDELIGALGFHSWKGSGF